MALLITKARWRISTGKALNVSITLAGGPVRFRVSGSFSSAPSVATTPTSAISAKIVRQPWVFSTKPPTRGASIGATTIAMVT